MIDRLLDIYKYRILNEYGKNTKRPGVVADGVPREAVKKSTDISILPHDLKGESFRDVSSYIEH